VLIDNETPLDLNVTVTVFNSKREQVQKVKMKNTATKRMTEGIALFLAGDGAVTDGRWRPNFISFATTGIDKQPEEGELLATVNDRSKFEDKTPPKGERTRPWFFSKQLGERNDRIWNPKYGWGTKEHPEIPCFQGELVTDMGQYVAEDGSYDDELNDPEFWAANHYQLLNRQPILRAEVTVDDASKRDLAQDEYTSDCILYGYTSVKWANHLLTPREGTPAVSRIAISEVGLYERNTNTPNGRDTLMAGFRVPTVEDIIYVEQDYVILVEWRITIRAILEST